MSVFKYYSVRTHNKISTYYISKSMEKKSENKRNMTYILSFIHNSHGKIMVSSESSKKYILIPVPHYIFSQIYPPVY